MTHIQKQQHTKQMPTILTISPKKNNTEEMTYIIHIKAFIIYTIYTPCFVVYKYRYICDRIAAIECERFYPSNPPFPQLSQQRTRIKTTLTQHETPTTLSIEAEQITNNNHNINKNNQKSFNPIDGFSIYTYTQLTNTLTHSHKNMSSRFFVDVLDKFVKHILKIHREIHLHIYVWKNHKAYSEISMRHIKHYPLWSVQISMFMFTRLYQNVFPICTFCYPFRYVFSWYLTCPERPKSQ